MSWRHKMSGLPGRYRFWLLLGALLGLFALLLSRGIGDASLGYPDADRILMDGVFILDFLRDFPLNDIYDYTVNYYVQYPALSIGYRPPFFPLVEALFNGVFGVSIWSSRLALIAIALSGVGAWFLLLRRIYDLNTAFAATLLLVTTPYLVGWGWYTMGELPVLAMAMLTSYCFYRFFETRARSWLYATVVVFSLTVWTKQTAFYLIFWYLAFLLVSGRFMEVMRDRDTWYATALLLLLLAPLAVITLWLGEQNLAQSVGGSRIPRLSWDNLKVHLLTLYRFHLTLPVLLMSLLGMGWAALQRDRRALFFGLGILVTYCFFTYLVGKNARYSIFWIPLFTLFAVLPFHYLEHRLASRPLLWLALIGVAAYQIQAIYARPLRYATGYEEAAEYVLQHSGSATVFFDGYNNGYFVYFMRARDPLRRYYVLRGDKLLSSSSISARHWLQVHAADDDDILAILNRFGVQYILVESEDRSAVPIHQRLRELLEKGPFILEKTIPVESNRPPLQGQRILIYRYRHPRPVTADRIRLHLPVVGETLDVPVPPRLRADGGR